MSGSLLHRCSKIIAVGRNYAAHAVELGNAIPTSPVLFLKPPSSLVFAPNPILIPHNCRDLHHEVELGVVIGKHGQNIPVNKVRDHIAGYVIALDMTARDLQEKAKKGGLPWAIAKGQDGFCPVSEVQSIDSIPDVNNIELWCSVNGELRQKGNTRDMIFKVDWLISYISSMFTLQPGDLILTGTPEGVGPVRPGDSVSAGISGITNFDIKFSAVQRPTPKL